MHKNNNKPNIVYISDHIKEFNHWRIKELSSKNDNETKSSKKSAKYEIIVLKA